MNGWALNFDDREPLRSAWRESVLALGNGYLVTRGSGAERSADNSNHPGTYIAGGYDRLPGKAAGRMIEVEELVNWPNWLALTFRAGDGEWLDTVSWTILEQRYTLDMQRGVLVRRLRVRDPEGRVTAMRSRRLVHMERAHLAAIEWEITPENWSGPIVVRSALDATVSNAASERHPGFTIRHLVPIIAEQEGDQVIRLLVETAQSHLRMAQAARTLIFGDGRELNVDRQAVELSGYVGEELRFNSGPGRTVRVEKTVAIFTSRDNAVSEPLAEAGALARRAPHFSELLRTHSLAWKRLWQRCDVRVRIVGVTTTRGEGPPSIQTLIRLQLFHILQTVSPHSVELDAGVPMHGWHGEEGRGHVSWDELFVFPLLSLRVPEIARAVLMYRFRRLGAARLIAVGEDARGARFPWRSGSNGRDESPHEWLDPLSGRWYPDHTHLQAHLNSAVVLDVWRYHQATADHEFLSFFGAEIVLEIARYWASRAVPDDADGRYHLRGVMGPVEAHRRHSDEDTEGVDDDAYTNIMAAWVLRCADRVLELLPTDRSDELCDQLELTDHERAQWSEVGRRLAVPIHDGVIREFAGADQDAADGILVETSDASAGDQAPVVDRLGSGDGVLMLHYLLGEAELVGLLEWMGYGADDELVARTVRHYLDNRAASTQPGSALSTAIRARVLATIDPQRSWSLFEQALALHGDEAARETIDIGAMAATVDVVQGGYLGVSLSDDVLWFDPRLPPDLESVSATLRYRGQSLDVRATPDGLSVAARDRGAQHPVRLGVGGKVHELRSGESL